MREKLKPCPFCGMEPKVEVLGDSYYINCVNGTCPCMPITWHYDTEDEAIEEWNRREGE